MVHHLDENVVQFDFGSLIFGDVLFLFGWVGSDDVQADTALGFHHSLLFDVVFSGRWIVCLVNALLLLGLFLHFLDLLVGLTLFSLDFKFPEIVGEVGVGIVLCILAFDGILGGFDVDYLRLLWNELLLNLNCFLKEYAGSLQKVFSFLNCLMVLPIWGDPSDCFRFLIDWHTFCLVWWRTPWEPGYRKVRSRFLCSCDLILLIIPFMKSRFNLYSNLNIRDLIKLIFDVNLFKFY